MIELGTILIMHKNRAAPSNSIRSDHPPFVFTAVAQVLPVIISRLPQFASEYATGLATSKAPHGALIDRIAAVAEPQHTLRQSVGACLVYRSVSPSQDLGVRAAPIAAAATGVFWLR
jgi:hypothetical protein